MSNPLPQGAIPKLYRQRNAGGKEIGNWYVRVKTVPINLRTQEYMLARERAREAYYDGKRTFPDERNPPLLALPPIKEKTATVELPQFVSPPTPSTDWAADVSRAAGEGLKPEVFPPGISPPSATTETPKTESSGATGTNGQSKISPQMIEGIIKQAASVLVELQIVGQEFLWRRWGKIEPGTVPETHDARKLSTELWEQAIREWIPTDIDIPPWILAPIVCAALTVPVQIDGAKPLKKPEEPSGTT